MKVGEKKKPGHWTPGEQWKTAARTWAGDHEYLNWEGGSGNRKKGWFRGATDGSWGETEGEESGFSFSNWEDTEEEKQIDGQVCERISQPCDMGEVSFFIAHSSSHM